MPRISVTVLALAALATSCGGEEPADGAGADSALADDGTDSSPGGDSASTDTSSPGDTTPGDGTSIDSGAPGDIGVWTDAPGACPAGMPKVDITTSAQLSAAARSETPYDGDAPATCYFLHDGTYTASGAIFYVTKGGASDTARRFFVGQSRAGVIIKGRGGLQEKMGIGNVTVQNMTFDISGYAATGSFNTFDLADAKNVTIDHVTFTGDCNTGLRGGHLETNGTQNLLVEACLIEKYGHCGPTGHEDHGVYLASGKNLTLRNNVIRGNASRGVQMFTNNGIYGTLDGVVLEKNRIHGNGHAEYEDGIVINAGGTGTIANVTVRRNLVYGNFYSGVRFVGGMQSAMVFDHNTFVRNGAGSTSASRSEINLDDVGAAAGGTFTGNLFDVGNTLINDCYDAATKGFHLGGNFVHGTVVTGTKASCLDAPKTGDPMFVDAAAEDYHPKNAAAIPYGAYAP
ncbi:MAG: right-handed parallel beta-helix repeat-containing protein [Polyangiales bacterium]